jgi:hypothetical protein
MSDGPAGWADAAGGSPVGSELFLNGVKLEGGRAIPEITLERSGGPAIIQTGAQTVTQHVWLGGNIPVNIHRRFSGNVTFSVREEEDYWLFLEAADKEQPVSLYVDFPWTALFYIPGNTAQTWRLGREAPWDLSGVTQVTHPPKALIDGVEMTVVATSPNPGEVRIPNSGGYITVTTNADDTASAEWLSIRYHPELHVVFADVSVAYPEFNHLIFRARIEETSDDSSLSPAQVAV